LLSWWREVVAYLQRQDWFVSSSESDLKSNSC
jgi:hypothetical protein